MPPGPLAEWNENGGRMGRREQSKEGGKEERGLNLSKNDQLTKSLIGTGFLQPLKPAFSCKQWLLFPWTLVTTSHENWLLITASTESTRSSLCAVYVLVSAMSAYLSYQAMLSSFSTAYTTFHSFLYKDGAPNRNKETANFFFFSGHA